MTYGIDTTFLIQLDVADHENHERACLLRDTLLDGGHDFALAPQVLSEYVHIVTDERRFTKPATMAVALAQSRAWWNAHEIRGVTADDRAVGLFHAWMVQYSIGRKRILDTLLAATYHAAGITAIVSSHARDYRSFFETVKEP